MSVWKLIVRLRVSVWYHNRETRPYRGSTEVRKSLSASLTKQLHNRGHSFIIQLSTIVFVGAYRYLDPNTNACVMTLKAMSMSPPRMPSPSHLHHPLSFDCLQSLPRYSPSHLFQAIHRTPCARGRPVASGWSTAARSRVAAALGVVSALSSPLVRIGDEHWDPPGDSPRTVRVTAMGQQKWRPLPGTLMMPATGAVTTEDVVINLVFAASFGWTILSNSRTEYEKQGYAER